MSEFSSLQPTTEHLEELMAGYVLNALSATEIVEFEDYLRKNPQLSQRLEELQELMGLIAYAPPTIKAPSHLLDTILEKAQVQSMPLEAVRQHGFPWQRIAAIGAVIAVLILGIDNYLLRQRLTLMEATIDTIQESETRGFALKGTKNVSNASGSVVLDLEAGKAVLALQKLPALPSGESYSLWAFTQKKKIFCGQFNTTASGQLIQEIVIPIREYDSPVQFMQISRESPQVPASAPQQAPIMTSQS